MADVNTGTGATLRMEAWVTSTSNSGNTNNFHWRLWLVERVASVYGWSGSVGASVDLYYDGGHRGVLWSGNFSFDFRPGGAQAKLIAEGDLNNQGNYNDGSPRVFGFVGNMGATGTSTAGGPASVRQDVTPPTTKVVPNTPTSVVATYVSDTKLTLSWDNSGASNGQPQSNQIYARVNGGAEYLMSDITATESMQVNVSANNKYEFRVKAWNSAGFSGVSAWSAPVYTTPSAPTNVVAVKDAAQDITVSFTENVGYAEYNHEVWHGTIAGGVTTWDGAPLATLSAGVTSYLHDNPNTAQVHVYRVRAKQGSRLSAYGTSGSVQLLAPPNAPSLAALPTRSDKAVALDVGWVHNPTDTTAQTAYEFQWSTNGGSTWNGTGKVVSTAKKYTVAANTHAANTAVVFRVRTWGQATTGGADGTGASDWSSTRTTTFKTAPTATITEPATGTTLNESQISVTVGFSQPEGATFTKAQIELKEAATVLETLESNVQVGIPLSTTAQNGSTYIVRARVLDSNGLWSAWASSTFDIEYLAPVPAVVSTSYLEDHGWGQVDLDIAAAGAGEAEVVAVTVLRVLPDGTTEIIVEDYPASSGRISFLDTTAIVNGTNTYRVTTKSSLDAQSTVEGTLITNEQRRAFLSKGASYDDVVVFGGNLNVDETLSVASDTMPAAGRIKPVGLYGVETHVQLKVTSRIIENFGSSVDAIRALLLRPGKACYRDASGRRVFGTVKGGVEYNRVPRADLSFTMTETS